MPPLSPMSKTCVALAISQLLALPSLSHATTIVVNSNTDDGVGCTLREAIVSANTSVDQNNGCALGSNSGTDTITFSNGLPSNTITLVNGRILVSPNKDIAINASANTDGITINANKASRVLTVNSSSLTLDNLTLTGGLIEGGESNGGGVLAYSSTLTLNNTTVSGNTASRRGGGIAAASSTINLYDSAVNNNLSTGGESTGANGGGISAGTAGSINITNSTVSGNTAFRVGGIYASSVNVTLSHSVMRSNAALDQNFSEGGAIHIRNQASLTVNNSTLSGNSAQDGGAIAALSGPTISVNNSTLSDNSAASRGGGIWVVGYLTPRATTLTLNNSTLSGNSAASRGGGINSYGSTVILNQTTLSANSAATGGAGIVASHGFNDTGTLTLNNSIIANSAGGDCYYRRTSAPVIIDSASIIEDGSCNANRSGDPGLLRLANNGGPTQTHALAANSMAINTGNISNCTDTDQRGATRDSLCDVGAFEFVDTSFFVVPLKNGKSVIFGL
ncbi:choice-of-anchor Q domain-containing protein [Arenicella xantha]|uniref:CSLREA domain-containing protein n=1 Tax=Arenicella xantha TaxID=644221 RepID=A0A395JJB9_9GAMM|nr:choice-of-anchor Q domain-containing protein [Arenicella xantha]RBP50599.1 hypothetical protein DFR28_10210 [Arenicella xantha]